MPELRILKADIGSDTKKTIGDIIIGIRHRLMPTETSVPETTVSVPCLSPHYTML